MVARVVGTGLSRAALTASRAALDRVALALVDRETLTLDEVNTLAGPPARLPGRYANGARARVPAGPTAYA
jgi:hypothetical protein